MLEQINKIINIDCIEGLKQLPNNSVDMAMFSPPYDNLRKYNGFILDLHSVGVELFRVLKEGSVAIMVIQDSTKDFAKSLTSFKTIIDWCDNVGFKLFECCIYQKQGSEGAWWTKRFRVDHEYLPIFLKGNRPAYFNKEELKIPSKHAGKTMTGCATRTTDGHTLKSIQVVINAMKCRGTIWQYITCGDGPKLKHKHPATFPDRLPYDCINCFCVPGGVVIDPFMGAGTTARATIQLNRNFIGYEISSEYCEIANTLIEQEYIKLKNLLTTPSSAV
jgi:site-specific DNA-methyltransferase (adenine-specific)